MSSPKFEIVNKDGDMIDFAATRHAADKIANAICLGDYDDNPRAAFVREQEHTRACRCGDCQSERDSDDADYEQQFSLADMD